ncbi:hypothetical protein [Sphaerospermopsis sp. LEGE 08334]|uniref:hypothetical protein n=1 Tax=Sphaerospermopsis sp. LEGE 08334 TaxID=1828651 RepID=UPI0018828B27|nr:hypothetical protein [Sphaerospermopsis sp. LEGE 08334]MBE9056508.1 hypothetical protein [Sphaerospermopsis sp. LEGE 08334]
MWDPTYLPHPQLSHNENWSFGDLELAIAYQYSLSLVQNTTFGRNEITKKPIVTPGGAEGRIQLLKLSPVTCHLAFTDNFFSKP